MEHFIHSPANDRRDRTWYLWDITVFPPTLHRHVCKNPPPPPSHVEGGDGDGDGPSKTSHWRPSGSPPTHQRCARARSPPPAPRCPEGERPRSEGGLIGPARRRRRPSRPRARRRRRR